MAEFWYKLVKSGRKTLEQVPVKWRALVEEMLKEDE